MDKYLRVPYKHLFNVCHSAFMRAGYSPEDATTIVDVMLTSDLKGIESHGVQRFGAYLNGIEIGRINPRAETTIINETPLTALLDAKDGIGPIPSKKAMSIAIIKAKAVGIGIVLVKNSGNFGSAGYYSDMAASEGLLGIAMTNSEALVVPTFGRTPMLGTNPIAVSMPAEPNMFHLDMATSVVPAGKVEVYNKLGKELPSGWIVNAQGHTSSDPHEFIMIRKNKTDGGILPLGGFGETNSGHKGFGLSLVVELMTGILAGGYTSPMVRKVSNIEKCCHFFAAIDYGMFGCKEAIEEQFSAYLNDIRASNKAEGCERIYIPGDKEADSVKYVMEQGVKMSKATYDEIIDSCIKLGMERSEVIAALGVSAD